MKYQISGALSTGKSTLINFLKKNYNIQVLEEIARKEIEKIPEIRKKKKINSKEFQLYLAEKQIKEEAKINSNFICDGGILMNITYMVFNKMKVPHPYITHLKTYERTFVLLTKEVPLDMSLRVTKGTRQEFENKRAELERIMFSLLKEYTIEYKIVTGTVKERAKKVISHIKR